jgi:hypothetical protein
MFLFHFISKKIAFATFKLLFATCGKWVGHRWLKYTSVKVIIDLFFLFTAFKMCANQTNIGIAEHISFLLKVLKDIFSL